MARHAEFKARQYALRSLRHYWRIHLAVLLGVAVGTAVLTGALIVGDSVRYSLRRLTLERLGTIDHVLLADHFFSTDLANRLQLADQPLDGFSRAVPVILLSPTTVQRSGATAGSVGQVTLIACRGDFWDLDTQGQRPGSLPGPGQIILNRPLADRLAVEVGDRVAVRLPSSTRIAADSALGEKENRVRSLAELHVIEIIPAEGLGRFSLQVNQALPNTAFLDLETVQRSLDQAENVNAVLIGGSSAAQAAGGDEAAELRARLRPTLADAGLHWKPVSLDYFVASSTEPQTGFQYLSLSTDTLMFPPAMEQAVSTALAGRDSQRVFAYLANSITQVAADGLASGGIPYSIVAAVEHQPSLTPLVDSSGQPLPSLADDQIVLTRWAADDLQVEPGATIRLTYFEPDTTHGQTREAMHDFTLKAIVPLDKPAEPYRRNRPARFTDTRQRTNDPDLTPTVPGITDAESIEGWDPPFPFDYRRIRKPRDEEYWEQHRTTPKAFVNWTVGQRLWQSRFGGVTSFRIVGGPGNEADVAQQLESAIAANPSAFGFAWLPVKQDGLRAAAGTTPFNLLFLGFSMFLIASALMLVCLMFRLSLEQRAGEQGLLLATGLTVRQVAGLMLREGVAIAVLGGGLGALLGVAYAALMILGLRTWWLAAVVTPFLELYVGRYTFLLGTLIGIVASLLTIGLTIFSLGRLTPLRLLSRSFDSTTATRQRPRRAIYLAAGCWLLAVATAVAAVYLRGEAQAGAFFAAGAASLTAILLQVWWWLRRPLAQVNLRRDGFSLSRMISRNISRHAIRTLLTLGLMATASFLIVAISAFRLTPTSQGTGGFALLAQSDTPIFDDLGDQATRRNVLGARADVLADSLIFALRLRDGDDASCRNLYQVQTPRVLGITSRFIEHFDSPDRTPFAWGATAAMTDEQRRNPWRLLAEHSAHDSSIPVVLDKNTALYSLHLYGGIGEEFELDYGGASGKLRFRVVGLLASSVLQGSLLVSEANLVKYFPDVAGYRYFLIAAPANQLGAVRLALQETYRDDGLQLSDTRQMLSELLAVQNTYLSTFQSLGGLGLLLGTLGLVAVQLRNVFERRGELALLRATGFSQWRLGCLVLLEHLALLCGGLGIGVAAALVAVIPHAWTTRISPPLPMLGGLLAGILVVGLIAGFLALRPVIRAPIVAALRSD